MTEIRTVSVIQNSSIPVNAPKRKYKCRRTNCQKQFLTKSGLQLHIRTHFPDKFLMKCFECDFTTFQKGNLAKHLSSIHGKNLNGDFLRLDFQCSSCEEYYLTESQLKVHVLRKHTIEKPFKCQLCDYKSSEKSDLRKHIRSRHTGEKPYACEICHFRSHTSSGISRHRRSHSNTKPFQCYLCQTTFADKKRLNSHLMKHNNEKPHRCPNCEYSTNRKDNLKIHIRRNHIGSEYLRNT